MEDPFSDPGRAGRRPHLYRQKQQLTQELRGAPETLRLDEMFAAVLGHDLKDAARRHHDRRLFAADAIDRRAQPGVGSADALERLSQGRARV